MKNKPEKKQMDEKKDLKIEESAEEIEYEDESLPQDKLKKLREKLKKCEEEKREYLEGWQRAKADAVNEKRRFAEDLRRAKLDGKKEALEKIIPVLDSFHMAFQGDAWESLDSAYKSGIEYIFNQFKSALTDLGAKDYAKEGEGFDPLLHEALKDIETDDKDKDLKIAKVLRKGYMIEETVLRPAQVEVYKLKK